MRLPECFTLLLERYLAAFIAFYYPVLHKNIDWEREAKTLPIPFPNLYPSAWCFNHLVEVTLMNGSQQLLWLHWNLAPKLELWFMSYLSQGIQDYLRPAEYHQVHCLTLIADKRLIGDAKQYIHVLWPHPKVAFSVANLHDHNVTQELMMQKANDLLLSYQQEELNTRFKLELIKQSSLNEAEKKLLKDLTKALHSSLEDKRRPHHNNLHHYDES